jgi:hypothetical protein
MKRGETFKLQYQWWNKGRPLALKSTGLGKALQAYEKNQADEWLALDGLLAVDAARKKALTMCNSPLFAETKAALQKTDALDFAVKVNLRRVQQGPIATMADSAKALTAYVDKLPRLLKQHEDAANPAQRSRLAKELGLNKRKP